MKKSELQELTKIAREFKASSITLKPSGSGLFVAFCAHHPDGITHPLKGAFSEGELSQKIEAYVIAYNNRAERLDAIALLEAEESKEKIKAEKKEAKLKAAGLKRNTESGPIKLAAPLTTIEKFDTLLRPALDSVGGAIEARGYVGKNGCYQVRKLVPANLVIPRDTSIDGLRFRVSGELVYQSYTGSISVSTGKKFAQKGQWMDSEDALSHMSRSEADRRAIEHGGQNSTGFYVGGEVSKYVYVDLINLKRKISVSG